MKQVHSIKPRKLKRKPKGSTPDRKSFLSRLADTVDNAIGFFSPKWSLHRKASRQLHGIVSQRLDALNSSFRKTGGSSYDGAANDRVRGERWLASEVSPDAGLEEDIEDLQVRCDDLYRNNTIYHAAIESRVSHEVGVGITPQARVRAAGNISDVQAKAINEYIESSLEAWSSRGVDGQRRNSLYQMQRIATRSYANYGEIFALLGDRVAPEGGFPMTVDIVNPARISTPPEKAGDPLVRMGIQYNEAGDILGYWMRTTHPDEVGIYFEYRWTYVPRYDSLGHLRMAHVFDEIFPGQTRGIPWLHAAMTRIKDLDDFFEAELVAKQIEACFGLIFTNPENATLSPYEIAEANSTEDRNGHRLEDLEPGIIHYANAGEEVKTVDPQRPGASFAPFVELALRSISAAGNYPYELIAKNFFRTTFSSGQLAMIDGSYGFNLRNSTLKEQLLDPVYCRFVYELVFLNELGGNVDLLEFQSQPHLYERHNWQPQGRKFLNPRDETQAAVDSLEADITTLADIYAEQGHDASEKLAQRHQEKLKQIEDDVALRQHQWELEEAAGLPHKEEMGGTPDEEQNGEESQQASQDAAEEANVD
jgi:lambda family phage portal protein